MGSKTSTVTEKSDPWGPSQPYILDTMKRAQNLYNNNSMVPPENATLIKGYNKALGTADFNPSTTNASHGLMMDTINGNYMNNNPYLDATFDRMSDKVTDGVNSNFSMAGRYGSGAHQGILGESLGNLATDVYGSNYRTERQNQLSAGQFAPQLDAANQSMLFNNANMFLDVGNSMQNYDQMVAMDPYNRLSHYSGVVNGIAGLGGSGTQTSPGGSTLGGAIGGGLTGAAAGAAAGGANGMIFGLPGAAVGAGLGAIGGLF